MKLNGITIDSFRQSLYKMRKGSTNFYYLKELADKIDSGWNATRLTFLTLTLCFVAIAELLPANMTVINFYLLCFGVYLIFTLYSYSKCSRFVRAMHGCLKNEFDCRKIEFKQVEPPPLNGWKIVYACWDRDFGGKTRL